MKNDKAIQAEAAVLEYLRTNGPAKRGEIITATGLGVWAKHAITKLTKSGAIIASGTPGNKLGGEGFTYSIKP